MHRDIENITYLIQPDKIPELTMGVVSQVQKKINDAVEAYIEINTMRDCMDRTSPSFNSFAHVDDGQCVPPQLKFPFGEFIQTCTEDSRTSK